MADSLDPMVEMLWELHDPQEALDERFGFPDPASAGRWLAATVHQHWGMQISSCERIVISDRNALGWFTTRSGRWVAKWSVRPERFERLTQLARLTQWLERRGLPVSAQVVSSDDRLQVEDDGVSMGLQRAVPGPLLDVTDADQVRAAGAVLARLHLELAGYPAADEVAPPGPPRDPLATRISTWLRTAGDQLPGAAHDALRGLIADVPADGVPTQVVHGDFRSANILCAGSRIAAVIDFEEARRASRIDELARSAVMLGTRFRNWGPVSAEVRATLRSGYQAVWPLTPAESRWCDVLVLWYAVAIVPPGDDPTGWGRSARSQLAALHTRG